MPTCCEPAVDWREPVNQPSCENANGWPQYHGLILRYLVKHTGDAALAQDLSQDVFEKMYRSMQAAQRICNLRSWLLQTAHHALIDHYRKHNRLRHDLSEARFAIAEGEVSSYRVLSDYVRPLLRCLPDTYAQALELELDGVPQKDIALRLQLDLSTTKSRIQRSRKKMHGLFYECFHLDLDPQGHVESFAVRPDCITLQAFLIEQEKNVVPSMHLFGA